MGKIFLRSEKASDKAYTTEIISNIIREEAKGRFEARTAVPGHVQQGGTHNGLCEKMFTFRIPISDGSRSRREIRCEMLPVD